MRRALYILAIILISACGSRNRNAAIDNDDIEMTALDSDDGNVRVLGWHFRAGSGDGYDWLYHYDKATKTLYHPSSPEYNHLSDRYIPYVWSGKTLKPMPEVGNPFLHQSLKEYTSLVSLFRTNRNWSS